MDRHALAMLIPIICLTFTGLIGLSFTRIGRAIANRIEGKADRETQERLAALEASHDDLRQALADAYERLDFAERALLKRADIRIDTPV
ncbi:MAG TPA: hypothetical protein VG692_13490 [Gemmatimonadales bacterium]|nr:hypothetical protein [Gemmatimonadales bacterium]